MSTIPAPSAPAEAINDDLDALHALLCAVAQGDPPARERAVVYADCRARLLASSQGRMLPGFLYQCATIDRFREFIHLYDPDVDLRLQFVARMIDRARPAAPLHAPAATRRASAPAAWEF